MGRWRMNILFIHQNMPGQFKHLAPMLAAQPGNRVVFLTQTVRRSLPGVEPATYPAPRASNGAGHHYLRRFEDAVRHGQQAARAIQQLARSGFRPDLVIAHPGWGEALFVKDVLPATPLILFAELCYRSHGLDIGFDPEEECTIDTICRTRIRNAPLLTSLESCDAAVSPTKWQKASHPEAFHDKIDVIFDGIDVDHVRPRPAAGFTLPDGRVLRRGDPVITYVARNLEPYRGFRTFMRAIPHIQRLRPDAEILIIGGDDVSYGSKPATHPNWREAMCAEVPFDPARVHFTGRLGYDAYLDALAVSAAHVYLTYPFVLSWSCVEAMAMGALVIASDTGPVREVITDGVNGILVDFFDARALAHTVTRVLPVQAALQPLRDAARATVVEHYALGDSLAKWQRVVERVAGLDRRATHIAA
ncbi:glycosyl transferase family 1 [Sphingomonas sp. KC8]|nr:glycosyl transferase family 1 [Sphingomonas sp. KC8]